jgi:hypothetical protein
MRAYGMPLSGSGKLFCEGALWGFLGLTSILLLMRAAGVFYFGVPNPNSGQVLTFGVLWGIAFFLVGVFEEFGFRGYAQFTLSTGLNFWLATALTTLLFLAGHVSNPGETPLGLLDVVLSGVVLCVALLRTGNLWFPIGLHAAWDWAESFFYGVPDSGLLTKGHLFEGKAHGSGWLSGGSAGPEGSIFSVVIEIAFIILLLWRFKENRFPDAKYVVRQQNALL